MDHLNVLSKLDLVLAVFSGLLGILMLLFVCLGGLTTVMGAMGGDMSGGDIASMIFPLVLFAIFDLVIFAMTAGLVMVSRKVARGEGRVLQSVIAVMGFTNFPIGFLFGGYALWVCWMNPETKAKFEAA